MWSVYRWIRVVMAFQCNRLMFKIPTGASFLPISMCQHPNSFFFDNSSKFSCSSVALEGAAGVGIFSSGRQPRFFCNWLAEAPWECGVSSGLAGALGQLRAVHGLYAWAHLDKCQMELLKGTGRWPLERAFQVVMAYGHDVYLTDAHFHLYQVVTEASKKKCHQAVKLEFFHQKFDLSGVQLTVIVLCVLLGLFYD